jgi:hypothetical protein
MNVLDKSLLVFNLLCAWCWFEIQRECWCVFKALFACGWRALDIGLFCANHPWTTLRKTMETFSSNLGSYWKGCWKLFWCVAKLVYHSAKSTMTKKIAFNILVFYVILHNIIMEDEFTLNLEPCLKHVIKMGCGFTFQQFMYGIKDIENQ